MEATESGIVGFISKRVREQWSAKGQPYLLNAIVHDLEKEGVRHRNIIGKLTLKSFLKKNEFAGGYEVVQDPRTKAVGIVPKGVHRTSSDANDITRRPAKTLSLKKTETSLVKQSFSHGRTKAIVLERERTKVEPESNVGIPQAAPAIRGVVLRQLTEEEKIQRGKALRDARIHKEEAPGRAEGRNTRPLPPRKKRPRSIAGVPSAFGYGWSKTNRLTLTPSSADLPRFPFPSSERDFAKRLETSRVLAEELAADLEQEKRYSNVRKEFRDELMKYVARLPHKRDEGNILLADASARNLRRMLAEEVDMIPSPVATRLATIIEQHIGLRPYYPEVEVFYRDVRKGRLNAPLPLDAIEQVMRAVQEHTPSLFDQSVVAAIDESAKPNPTIVRADSPVEVTGPLSPPDDPLGELDSTKAHDFQAAGVVNKLWQVYSAGEKIYNSGGAWKDTYHALAPPVSQVLEWLKTFLRP